MASDRPINWLSKHVYKECSDLVPLKPIFSCDACDRWRSRCHGVQYKRRSGLERSELSIRYQCTRVKRGYKPIRIRIICNAGEALDAKHQPNKPQCLTLIANESSNSRIESQRRKRRAIIVEESKLLQSVKEKHLQLKKHRAMIVTGRLEELELVKRKVDEKEQECSELEKENSFLQS